MTTVDEARGPRVRMVITFDPGLDAGLMSIGITATSVEGLHDPRLADIVGNFEPTIWEPTDPARLPLAEAVAVALAAQGLVPLWVRSDIPAATLLETLQTDETRAYIEGVLKSPVRWLPAEPVDSPPAAERTFITATSDGQPWPEPPDAAVFYGLAGDFVRAVEPHSEADPVALLLRFMTGFGNMIGAGPHFRIEADAHRGNLFVIFVGRSSKARKGVSEGRVRETLGPIDPDWERYRVQSGLSSGEGLIWAVRDEILKREKRKGKYEDVVADPGVSDKRLLVVEGEFGSTLRVMQRDGSTLSAVLRLAWDGREVLQTLTKNSPARATGAHVSVVAHITKDELVRYLDRTELVNGFGNRHLTVCIRRSKYLPEGGSLDPELLQPLIERARVRAAAAKNVLRVEFDPAARVLWHKVYPNLSAERPGLFGAMTARAEPQCLRLSLLYALLDGSPMIREEHLWAALCLWAFCETSALVIFGDSQGDPVADDILFALRARTEGMTRTEIRDLFSKNKSANEIERALELLDRYGLAKKSSERTSGRPLERWRAATKTTETTKGSRGVPSFRSFLSSMPVPTAVQAWLTLTPARPPALAPGRGPPPLLTKEERINRLVDALERALLEPGQGHVASAKQALHAEAGDELAAELEADLAKPLEEGRAA